jgi:hypothetical protein
MLQERGDVQKPDLGGGIMQCGRVCVCVWYQIEESCSVEDDFVCGVMYFVCVCVRVFMFFNFFSSSLAHLLVTVATTPVPTPESGLSRVNMYTILST